MARYRPVSPVATWRDPLIGKLEIPCRFAELYFLTSTFTNAIGCYQIVDSIAAVEIGVSLDEFTSIVRKLVGSGIIVRYEDHILVTRWFKHHAWESVLKGNVAPMAIKEVAALPAELRDIWVKATINAGAPREFVSKITPLGCPLDGGDMGDEYNTKTKTLTETPTETSARTTNKLYLLASTEIYRGYLERETAHLNPTLVQQIADELAGVIAAAKSGIRHEIGSIEGWLNAVIKRAEIGDFRQELGPSILKEREAYIYAKNKIASDEAVFLLKQQLLDERVQRAELQLQCFSSEHLAKLIAKFSYSNVISSAKTATMESLREGKVLRGPGCVAALEIIEELSTKGFQ